MSIANMQIMLGVYEGQNRGFVADIGMIPAPDAIALLGMAGIFGTRRRR